MNYMGSSEFVWWHGVVEDVNDPLFLGRCKVRVFGYHSDDLLELPTSSLPWAFPMQPITSASLSGIGTSPTGLLVGSHVFGFFRDGSSAQDPVMIGSFGGIPFYESNKNKGFNDPSGKYPATEEGVKARKFPVGVSVVRESDVNKLARGESPEKTIVGYKKSTVKKNIKSAPDTAGSSVWSEPETPYNARYPKNHVRFTESGSVEEFDDTPGAERIHQWHTSGSFTEIGNGWTESPDGTRVQRIVGDDYEICHGNKKIYVSGTAGVDIVIEGGLNITVNNGCNIQLNGSSNILVKGDMNAKIDGSMKVSGKQIEFFADENIAFSGKVVSFISDGSVMNVGSKIEVNSGPAPVRPSRAKVK